MITKNETDILRAIPTHRIFGIVVILSLVLNLSFVFIRGDFQDPRMWENGEIALNILEGNGYSSSYLLGETHTTSVMAPFYPYFLVVMFLLFGTGTAAFVGIQVVHSFVQAGAVVLLFLLASRVYNEKVGLLASGIMAIYPVFIYGVTVIHQLTFTTFLVLASVLALHRAGEKPTIRRAVFAGVIMGTTVLALPSMLFFVPFGVAWLFWQVYQRDGVGVATSLAASTFVLTVLMFLPWTVRNYLVFDELLLMKLSGWNFWRGNVPPAVHTGSPITFDEAPRAVRQRVQSMSSEAAADDYFMTLALDYVLTHPVVYFQAVLERIAYFWWFPPVLENQAPLMRKIVYAPVLLTGIIGLAVSRRQWRDNLLLYLVMLAFTIGYSLFFVLPRYRVPTVLPVLMVFSAIGVIYVWNAFRAFVELPVD